ncbi:MAG: glycosyltransferase family 2 protein [Anaerolineae bacterium]|nr:glycosyltransferase family 2 protein [Anaerolineae bacterium]
MPEVSIIIPCYNEEKTILFLLQSLFEQTYRLEAMEVIISDGLSTDHTRDVISRFSQEHPELTLKVVNNQKRDIPSAFNIGLANAAGEFIVRLDAHSVPVKNYIELCVSDLKAGKGDNVGGVWDIRPSDDSWMAGCISIAAAHRLGVGDAKYRYTSEAAEVDTVPFGSYRRELFERIGVFDEKLLTNEDYEFNTRIRKNGGKIWLNPAIRTIYFSRPDLISLARQYWRYGYWKWRMLKDNPTTLRWRQALPPLFVSSIILWLVAACFLPVLSLVLAAEVVFYAAAIFSGVTWLDKSHQGIKTNLGVSLAIMCMHFFWGAGFLWSMVKSIFGR